MHRASHKFSSEYKKTQAWLLSIFNSLRRTNQRKHNEFDFPSAILSWANTNDYSICLPLGQASTYTTTIQSAFCYIPSNAWPTQTWNQFAFHYFIQPSTHKHSDSSVFLPLFCPLPDEYIHSDINFPSAVHILFAKAAHTTTSICLPLYPIHCQANSNMTSTCIPLFYPFPNQHKHDINLPSITLSIAKPTQTQQLQLVFHYTQLSI